MEENRIAKPWKKGVIVKMMGRGMLNRVNLGQDFYLVTFTIEEDQRYALLEGPWLIYDHYLTIRE